MTLYPRGPEDTTSTLRGLDPEVRTSMQATQLVVSGLPETGSLNPEQIAAIMRGLDTANDNRAPVSVAA